mgnify:CR=1 FL=1
MVCFTLEELWAIHDLVRDRQNNGEEHDPEFEIRLFEALLAGAEHASRQAAMLVYEDDLWWIDRQVPSALMAGTLGVGRSILTKVVRLLVKAHSRADSVLVGGA